MSGGADAGLDQLLDQAARFDDPALEHLANKGLLRRANKLLGETVTLEVVAASVRVFDAGWEVTFDVEDSPTKGQCPCATAGVCQHLLAAIMYLRDHAVSGTGSDAAPSGEPTTAQNGEPSTDPVTDAGPDLHHTLEALTEEELAAWAKKSDYRWAVDRAVSLDLDQVVLETGGHINVELPLPHANVRFMSPSLDDALVKPSGRNDRRAVTLAVLALWRCSGRTISEPERDSRASSPTVELTGERASITARATRLCVDLIAVGLLHLGDAERERLDSLAASARGVKLYRLAILAERASDHVQALSELPPEADTQLLLDRLAEIVVLSEAISKRLAASEPLPDGLKGLARSTYEPVGQLDLVGLGHYNWGDRRFAGSTAVLAESADRIFTLAKPRVVGGRTIMAPGGWRGVGGLPTLTGRRLSVSNALANDALRLSGTDKTSAAPGESVDSAMLSGLAWDGRWPVVGSRLNGQLAQNWVVLSVAGENRPLGFDQISQESAWALRIKTVPSATVQEATEIRDVTVRLPYRAETAQAVRSLEQIAAKRPPSFIVGRLRASGPELELWPISAMAGRTFINLADVPESEGRKSARNSGESDVEALPVSHLDRVKTELVRIADGGRRPSATTDLTRLANTATGWGFPVIGDAISHAPDHGTALLRACWVEQTLRDLDN